MIKKSFVNGNVIKILALITMVIDHVGYMLFPQIDALRIIGRISMPLFAFMIAEGCFYTKNRLKHFLLIFGLGVICQIVFFVAMNSLLMGVLISFSLSILVIYAIDNAIKNKNAVSIVLALCVAIVTFVITYFFPIWLKEYGLTFDYGFLLVWLPVGVYYFKNHFAKLIVTAIFLIAICLVNDWSLQWYSLIALLPLALYNGKKGKLNLKYLFYIAYPLHLVIIAGISFLA